MNISRIIAFVIICFFANGLIGQNPINSKAYILFKGYPYVVYLSPDGDIVEFVRAAPEVMNGMKFDKNQPMPIALGLYTKPEVLAAPVYNSPKNVTIIGDVAVFDEEVIVLEDMETTSFEIKEDVVDLENTESTTIEKKEAPVNEDVSIQVNDDAKIISTTVINRDNDKPNAPVIVQGETDRTVEDGLYILKFQGFTSRLTPALIDLLRDISKEHKKNQNQQVIINSFMTQGDSSNKSLAENRMAACRDLLENYGVPAEKLSTQILPYNSLIDGNVSIKFQE